MKSRILAAITKVSWARVISVAFTLLLIDSSFHSFRFFTHAQDAREALGPKDSAKGTRNTGPHPLVGLIENVNAQLRPELIGAHPRVFVTEAELVQLRRRTRTTHQALWQPVLQKVRALAAEPPPSPAQKRRSQNDVGIAIAEAAFVYKIEGDKKYLDAAKKYMDAAVSYDVWGYTYNKPNVDLAAGHLLYGLGWGYDLLYHDLSSDERQRYREKLRKQARLLANHYEPKTGRTFAYSQNHVFIPMAGLGVAAYALYDEIPEAKDWAKLARAIYDRVLATYSLDGYYYEGFEYWIFSTPWLIHYIDAHAHATGEDLYDRPGFRQMHKYVAHSMLPGGKYVFDFGDIFEGPLTRAGQGNEYKRTHPNGSFHTNYNLLYRIASRFRDSEVQGVAAWLATLNQVNAEDFWSLVWYDSSLAAIPMEKVETWHYFRDHEVVYWRTNWSADATAFAFKSGPPEGHHTTDLLKRFPDWHLSSGHAHPDANSFIIYAKGQYLTGDSGYAGVPMTEHHNTVLIGGRGQAREGKGHDPFAEIPYERMDKIHIKQVKLGKGFAQVIGDATAAYEPELGVKRFERHFMLGNSKQFEIRDYLETAHPQTFTVLLHADDTIQQAGKTRFVIKTLKANLNVNVPLPDKATTKIEPNWLIGAGSPGSVDKGERQQRGERLAITTAMAATQARFVVVLNIAERER